MSRIDLLLNSKKGTGCNRETIESELDHWVTEGQRELLVPVIRMDGLLIGAIVRQVQRQTYQGERVDEQ